MVKYGEDGPGEPGTVQHSIFTLNGQVFMAIDADNGEELPMNPSISLYISLLKMLWKWNVYLMV